MTPAARFTEHLNDLGIPIHGVSINGDNVRIDFKDEATPQQRSGATNAANGFDFSEREPKTADEIEVELPKLTPAQRASVLDKIIAEFLVSHPRIAKAVEINNMRNR